MENARTLAARHETVAGEMSAGTDLNKAREIMFAGRNGTLLAIVALLLLALLLLAPVGGEDSPFIYTVF